MVTTTFFAGLGFAVATAFATARLITGADVGLGDFTGPPSDVVRLQAIFKLAKCLTSGSKPVSLDTIVNLASGCDAASLPM